MKQLLKAYYTSQDDNLMQSLTVKLMSIMNTEFISSKYAFKYYKLTIWKTFTGHNWQQMPSKF